MNTRFNPTANGRLHLGHLYLVLVNVHAARSSGGTFTLRFDDNQPYWTNLLGREAIHDFCDAAIEDLGWFGIKPDVVTYQSREDETNESSLGTLCSLNPPPDDGISPVPQIVGCSRPYPYVPRLTALKVVQDAREKIDCVIRGDDLVSEFSLYCYFCEVLSLPIPRFIYVPKLVYLSEDLSDVSKSTGEFKIADLRQAGYTADELRSVIAKSCLIDPAKDWEWTNIKRTPALSSTKVPK